MTDHANYDTWYFFECSPDMMLIGSLDGYFLQVNGAWERTMGYAPHDLVGRHFSELIHPDDAWATEQVMETAAEKPVGQFINRWRHKDGAYRYMEWSGRYYEGVVYAIARDVSEREETKARLETELAFSAGIVANMQEGFVQMDANRRLVKANQAACEIIGFAENELVGTVPPFKDWPPAFTAKQAHEGMASGEQRLFETTLMRKDGRTANILLRPFLLFDASGRLASINATFQDITSYRNIEDTLRKSEASLNRAQRMAKTGSWEFNLRTQELLWSEEHYRLFELSLMPSSQLYEAYRSKIHPDDLPALDAVINQSMATGRPLVYEHRVCCSDGGIRYVLGIGEVEMDANGQPCMMHGTAQDITERKLQEIALEASEERYRQLVEQQADFVLLSLPDTTITFANRALCKALGVTLPEIVGKRWIDFADPDDLQQILRDLGRLSPAWPSFLTENRDRRDGNIVGWTQWLNQGVFDSEGRFVEIQSVGRDITGIRKAELALKEEQQRFIDIVNSIDGIVWEFDLLSKRFTFVSEQAVRLLGYGIEEWVGLGFWADNMHPDDRDWAISYCESQTEAMLPHDFDYRFRSKGGGYIWLRDMVRVIAEKGRPVKLRGVMVDISAQKEMEFNMRAQKEELRSAKIKAEEALNTLALTQQQMVQHEKMASLGLLTAGIAHEINNPVNYITGGMQGLAPIVEDMQALIDWYAQAEGAALGFASDEARARLEEIKGRMGSLEENRLLVTSLLESMKEGANRVIEIVSGLRDFSRADTGQLQSDNLHQNIENALLILHSSYKNRIVIERNFDKDIQKIKCYPGQLGQVFLNLISNAVDAIEGKGTIAIATRKLPNGVEISVADTGKGMNEEVMKKIFDPFFTTKAVGKGTGLGLSIAYGIIEKHQGTISVESAQGKGAVFRIFLPSQGEE